MTDSASMINQIKATSDNIKQTLQSSISNLSQSSAAFKSTMMSNLQAIAELINRLPANGGELQSCKSTLTTTQADLAEKTAALGELQSKMTQLQQASAEKDEKLNALTTEQQRLTEELAALKQKDGATQEQIQSLQASINECNSNLEQAKQEKASANDFLAAKQNEYNTQLAAIQTALNENLETIAALSQQTSMAINPEEYGQLLDTIKDKLNSMIASSAPRAGVGGGKGKKRTKRHKKTTKNRRTRRHKGGYQYGKEKTKSLNSLSKLASHESADDKGRGKKKSK